MVNHMNNFANIFTDINDIKFINVLVKGNLYGSFVCNLASPFWIKRSIGKNNFKVLIF
jgi:hypothetical protein